MYLKECTFFCILKLLSLTWQNSFWINKKVAIKLIYYLTFSFSLLNYAPQMNIYEIFIMLRMKFYTSLHLLKYIFQNDVHKIKIH